MAFEIYVSLMICNLINIVTSQNTALHKTINSEAHLFVKIQALVKTMNGFIPEITNNVDDVKNQIQELKSAFNAQFNSEMNESLTSTFLADILQGWG